MFVQKSFGFDTAVAKAVEAVGAAHVEAKSAPDGIGIVKVMGRDSGFIAAHTTLSTSDVNFCLNSRDSLRPEWKERSLKSLEDRLDRRKHAVVLVAEGAGQELLKSGKDNSDASGNQSYGDIGLFLKDAIKSYLVERGREANIKYIDTSYIIRAAPANPVDSHYCARLGANAVHAAMTGRTGCIIGQWNTRWCTFHSHGPLTSESRWITKALSGETCWNPRDNPYPWFQIDPESVISGIRIYSASDSRQIPSQSSP